MYRVGFYNSSGKLQYHSRMKDQFNKCDLNPQKLFTAVIRPILQRCYHDNFSLMKQIAYWWVVHVYNFLQFTNNHVQSSIAFRLEMLFQEADPQHYHEQSSELQHEQSTDSQFWNLAIGISFSKPVIFVHDRSTAPLQRALDTSPHEWNVADCVPAKVSRRAHGIYFPFRHRNENTRAQIELWQCASWCHLLLCNFAARIHRSSKALSWLKCWCRKNHEGSLWTDRVSRLHI